MCLLSKVLPLKLTRGFFNAGAMSRLTLAIA